MKNKEKNEKIIRKTEKELNLDLASTLAMRRLCSQYSAYDGYVVDGTRPMVSCEWYYDYKNDCWYSVHEGILAWYSAYDGRLLVVLGLLQKYRSRWM